MWLPTYPHRGFEQPFWCFIQFKCPLFASLLPYFISQAQPLPETLYAVTLHATCDDHMKVYFDGELQPETDAMNTWEAVSQLTIPAGTRVLAIECKDVGQNKGILASTSTGLKTDSSWRCSSTQIEGWTQPDFVFPPDSFASANTLGNNTVSPWIQDHLSPRLPNMKLNSTQPCLFFYGGYQVRKRILIAKV